MTVGGKGRRVSDTAGPYEEVARRLAGSPFGAISYALETESTNADAAARLGEERSGGLTLVAEYQRRGVGRKGRAWHAPPGTGLLFTTILPRTVATGRLWIVPFWTALAVREALAACGVNATLQWPNDLLLGERKLAGILCQSRIAGEQARVACGVGVNVRRPQADTGVDPPPAYCDDVAPVPRAALLHAILRGFESRLGSLDDPPVVVEAWERAALLPGRRYRIRREGEPESFEATAVGLTDDGSLRVLRAGGEEERIALGDARVLR